MELVAIVERLGENWTLALGGGVIGLVFGFFAQQSRFCLRSAATEFARGSIAAKTAVWLIVFSSAIAGTAALAYLGVINTLEARQIASPQSLSGAAVGGLMFGTGMILARGCASRLLVLAATGNLRALMSGLVFAVVAQASLHGFLSPARESIAGTLTTAATGGNNILELLRIDIATALALAALALAAALGLSLWRGNGLWRTAAALAVGLTIPGVPIIGVGRNPTVAWGGTNMRAASSDFYDVSKLPKDQITSRTETIKVRWWRDRKVTVRETPLGPVLSDAPVLKWTGKPFALRWIGHERGDEITAMLHAMRATNWTEFKSAFKTFAVSAQNMIYADKAGKYQDQVGLTLPKVD